MGFREDLTRLFGLSDSVDYKADLSKDELFDEAISWTRDTSVRRQMEAELLDLQGRAGL